MDLLDEVAQHLLGDVEVGDDPISEWSNGCDVGGSAPDHPFRLHADGQSAAVLGVDGDHRRLVEHDATAPHVDKRVGGSEIDGHVLTSE